MRPAASFSDGYRFEMGDSVEALFYNSGVNDVNAFSDEFVILEGGVAKWGISALSAMFAGLISILY
jgi:hypothetical protein